MKLRGYFESVYERIYTKKDGTEGRTIEGMFKTDFDTIRVSTWHDKQWCLEKGIKTGAAGELTAHFGTNDHGFYEQAIWGFKTQEQIAKEEAERAAKAQAVTPQEKTPEMEAAAAAKVEEAQNDPEAGKDLPF